MIKKNFKHIYLFNFQEESHGGAKRSEQLTEYFLKFNASSICLKNFKLNLIHFLPSIKNLFLFMWSLYLLIFHQYSLKNSIKLYLAGANLLPRIKDHDALYLFEIGSDISITMCRFLQINGYKIITLPHNIEFLVSDKNLLGFKSMRSLFHFERLVYKNSVCVFAISSFDEYILNCLGCKTKLLRFYPPKTSLDFINKVKNIRAKVLKKEKNLMLGTIRNEPTKIAFQNFIKNYKGQDLIEIIGFGTENLDSKNKKIEIIGGVSDKELIRYLSEAKKVIIPVQPTSGLLTRMIELKLMDIEFEIIGKYLQSREINDFDELEYQNDLNNIQEYLYLVNND